MSTQCPAGPRHRQRECIGCIGATVKSNLQATAPMLMKYDEEAVARKNRFGILNTEFFNIILVIQT